MLALASMALSLYAAMMSLDGGAPNSEELWELSLSFVRRSGSLSWLILFDEMCRALGVGDVILSAPFRSEAGPRWKLIAKEEGQRPKAGELSLEGNQPVTRLAMEYIELVRR